MHIADFLGYAAVHRGLTDQLAAVAPFPDAPDARCLLLSGPERCGKTTLLFHAALSLARQGASVLLLCRRQVLQCCVGMGGVMGSCLQTCNHTVLPCCPAALLPPTHLGPTNPQGEAGGLPATAARGRAKQRSRLGACAHQVRGQRCVPWGGSRVPFSRLLLRLLQT